LTKFVSGSGSGSGSGITTGGSTPSGGGISSGSLSLVQLKKAKTKIKFIVKNDFKFMVLAIWVTSTKLGRQQENFRVCLYNVMNGNCKLLLK
jgi:hypothetical protein